MMDTIFFFTDNSGWVTCRTGQVWWRWRWFKLLLSWCWNVVMWIIWRWQWVVWNFRKPRYVLNALKRSVCPLCLYRYFQPAGPQICPTPHSDPYSMEHCYFRLSVEACNLCPKVYLGLRTLLLRSLSACNLGQWPTTSNSSCGILHRLYKVNSNTVQLAKGQ